MSSPSRPPATRSRVTRPDLPRKSGSRLSPEDQNDSSVTVPDDLTRWRLRYSGGDDSLGWRMIYYATAPGCVNEFHRADLTAGCGCMQFWSAFAARLHIRGANLALDAENSPPEAS